MKTILYYFLLAAITVALVSCSDDHNTAIDSASALRLVGKSPEDKKQKGFFLSGTYVASEKGIYSESADTITIQKRSNSYSLYNLKRKLTCRNYMERHGFPIQQRTVKWLTSFDDHSNTLFVISKDIRIAVNPRSSTLSLSGVDFRKIE